MLGALHLSFWPPGLLAFTVQTYKYVRWPAVITVTGSNYVQTNCIRSNCALNAPRRARASYVSRIRYRCSKPRGEFCASKEFLANLGDCVTVSDAHNPHAKPL